MHCQKGGFRQSKIFPLGEDPGNGDRRYSRWGSDDSLDELHGRI